MAPTGGPRSLLRLPHALAEPARLDRLVGDRRPAVFLDYDGTLTPVVDDPAAATMPGAARRAVARLAEVAPVAIVSGRDRADVERLVGLDRLVYAGSHGFDLAGPGWAHRHPGGLGAQASLAAAADALDAAVGDIAGVIVERKAFAVAVHFRMAPDHAVAEIDRAVGRAAEDHPHLRRTTGKMVFELRPDLDWDKGTALRFLLGRLDLDRPEVVPLYVGDDDTDEDALRVVADAGVGIVVGGDDRPTWARLRLDHPGETVAFLTRLAERLEAGTAGPGRDPAPDR